MIYTRESQGNGQHKVQEEYEALAQRHGGTKKGLPQPKGEMSECAPNGKEDLTRAPMYRKALPFGITPLLIATRRFYDIMEWVCT